MANEGRVGTLRPTGWRQKMESKPCCLLPWHNWRAKVAEISRAKSSVYLAREVGFEPTTDRLTADCSTAELLPNKPRLR
jgi:hypothetical protein